VEDYQLIRKWLAIGIILLFLGVTIAPAMNANDDVIITKSFSTPKKDDMVSITVLEYRPDGTIGKSVIQLSKIQAEKLRTELNNVRELGKRLSIYKKYNLIPQNTTFRDGGESTKTWFYKREDTRIYHPLY
jgi:predicted phosphoribosyltransferase